MEKEEKLEVTKTKGKSKIYADRRRRDFAAPKRIGNIRCVANRDAGQIHLNEHLFHADFSAAVRSMIAVSMVTPFRRGMCSVTSPLVREIAVIMTAPVAMARFAALVTGRLRQLRCFLFQRFVERFLYAPAC